MSVRRKRISVRLEDHELEILDRLKSSLRTKELTPAIRFCINFTEVMLDMQVRGLKITSEEFSELLTKVVERVMR